MPINVDKVNEERARRNSGGELWDAPEGDTNCLIIAPPRATDELPFIETRMHYGLGPKSKRSCMCIEPAVNPLMLNKEFREVLELMKKDLGGGCVVCERDDKGLWVTRDPEQNTKPGSRWMWLLSPISSRTDPRAAFKPWPAHEVKGFFVGYKVWDAMSDLFGQAGDITDMNAAVLARISRVGKKLSTNWTIGCDVETTRKPFVVPKDLRAIIAEVVTPMGACDPLKLIANFAINREEQEKIFAEDDQAAQNEYSETTEETAPPADGKFKPPAKGKSQVSVPAGNTGKAAGATKAPPVKQPAKTAPATSTGTAAANAKMKALIAERGPQPSCYEIDPDPGEPTCLKCPWNKECFSKCGVELPEAEPEEVPAEEQAVDGMVAVEDCEAGTQYMVNGAPATYKGPAKGAFYFTGEDGKAVRVTAGESVEVMAAAEEEAPANDDNEAAMAKLEAELQARKARTAAGKASKK